MDARQQMPLRRSIKTKCSFLISLAIAIFLLGSWYVYYISKTLLREAAKTGGIRSARHIAYHMAYGEGAEDNQGVVAASDNLLLEDELLYLAILDKNGEILVSKHRFDQDSFVLPADLHMAPCGNSVVPLVNMSSMNGENVYHVGIHILPPYQNSSNENALEKDAVPGSDCLGTVYLGVSLKNFDKKLYPLLFVSGLMAVFAVLAGILAIRLLSQRVVNPLLRMAEIARKIAKGDLRQKLDSTSKDEVGALESALSQIIQSAIRMATNLQGGCEQLKNTSDDILNMSAEQSAIFQRQTMSLSHITQTIENIAEASKQIASHVESVVEVADSTLQFTQNMGDTVKNTMENMEEMREQTVKNTERVLLLGEKIVQISDVVKIINTIADQTKLIAFNASIEAAGAGEAGGRFSIVAAEVRRLANTVVESVEEISNSVSSIQNATNELILSSETGIRKVNQGAMLIAENGQAIQQIMALLENITTIAAETSRSMQQQSTENGKMVLKGIQKISDESDQVIETHKKAHEIACELHALAEELGETVHQVRI